MPRGRHKGTLVIGLMSGTSADGVDAILVQIQGRGEALRVTSLAFRTVPYPRSLRERLLDVSSHGTVAELCHLNVLLGELFARAAMKVVADARVSPGAVALIGSHGQTVQHRPNPVREPGVGVVRSTLQIAEPAVIAERTGITTIANFRPRDMAVGGQGAPLTPYAHWLLLRHPRHGRLIVNIGGISNVTYLPAAGSLAEVRAFDTGPGNMVLDGVVQRVSGGRLTFDRDGRWARQGTVHERLLADLLRHPFLARRPPKSTGREEFGAPYVERLLGEAKHLPPADLLATCTQFTAKSIADGRRWLRGRVDEVVVCGGGVRNRTLVEALMAEVAPARVRPLEALGWDSKAFEALAFAVLAYQTARGMPNNVPAVTGARHPVVLGTIVPASLPGSRGRSARR